MRNKTLPTLAVLAIALVSACGRAGDETATGATELSSSTTTTTTTTTSAAETSEQRSHGLPAYGVVETTKSAVAAGDTTCEPETPPVNPMEASTGAPGAPTVIVDVPDGFTPGAPPSGDVALNLTGPDGLTGTVRISPTTLDPAAAFQQYADQRTADYEINSVSLLPGELCAYSGQELMGVLADDPAQTIDYADRIIHVWTNNGDYLIAVQLQGPAKSADLDAAKSVLLADFGIRMG